MATTTQDRKRKTNSGLSKALTRSAFGQLDLGQQVRAAMPFARALVMEGLCPETSGPTEELIMQRVAELTDDDDLLEFWEDGANEEQVIVWSNRLEAARALGIALGLMLRPEAFAKDGAR